MEGVEVWRLASWAGVRADFSINSVTDVNLRVEYRTAKGAEGCQRITKNPPERLRGSEGENGRIRKNGILGGDLLASGVRQADAIGGRRLHGDEIETRH
jgi:hypothetical protein